MEFKTFLAMCAKPLRLGKNRYEKMCNLLDLVTMIPLVYSETESGRDYDFSKSQLESIASGNRQFSDNAVGRILDADFVPSMLIERVDALPIQVRESFLQTIRLTDPGVTLDFVGQWCGDYLTNVLLRSTADEQQIARVQAIFEQTRIEGAQRRFMELLFAQAGSKCPNLNCVNPLVTIDDAGQSKRVGKVVVIDPDKDHAAEENLIVLCPGCADLYSGKNTEKISILESIKLNIRKSYADAAILDITGMEDEIRRVLQKMARASAASLQQGIKEPLTISQKITEDVALETEVTGHVTLWFNFIDDELINMDYSQNWTFERVRHEVKGQYLNLTGRNWSQDEIFEHLTQWLVDSTHEKRRACAAVISYFIQKCEVF